MFRWTLPLVMGPNECIDAAVTVDHRVYAFGWTRYYTTEHRATDVYVFDTLSLAWTKLPPCGGNLPSDRYYHTAVLVADGVYIWGGFPLYEPLHVFNVTRHAWHKPRVFGNVPEKRYHHSACALGAFMYVYGGETHPDGTTDTIHKLDTANMHWSLVEAKGTPAARSMNHSATMIGTNMLVFGGQEKGVIRVFDTVNDCWLDVQNDKGGTRSSKGHKAFVYAGEMYIVDGDLHSKTIQKFNPGTFSWKAIEPKGAAPGWKEAPLFCMVGHRIFAFGGFQVPVKEMDILDFHPSLKTLCKQAVVQHHIDQSKLPHNIKWELDFLGRFIGKIDKPNRQ